MRTCAAFTAVMILAACTSGEKTSESPAINESNSLVVAEAPPAVEPVNHSQSAGPQVSACQMQDGTQLQVAPIKALGTEPFWATRTAGRCVTYSTPEDQAGTRIWTKIASSPRETIWIGALRGKSFRLSVKPKPGCSDGMSDNEYPMEVELSVDGETRTGCAKPL